MYLEAADELRCARQPPGAWHRLPGDEMLMVDRHMLSVRASQVWCTSDDCRFPQGWTYLPPTSECSGMLHFVFVGGRNALRR